MYTLYYRSEAKKSRKECEDRKSALIDALHRKCKALLELSEGSLVDNMSVLGTGDLDGEEGREQSATTTGLTAELISGAVQTADVSGAAQTSDGQTADVRGITKPVEGSGSSKLDQEFKDAFSELRKWVDTGVDVQYAALHAANEIRAER